MKNVFVYYYYLVFLIVISGLFTSCNKQLKTGEIYTDIIDVKGIKYDAYFTWKNYSCKTGKTNLEKTVFIWQGQEVGTGTVGFFALLSRIWKLPAGSKILAYPYRIGSNFGSEHYSYPTDTFSHILRKTIKEQKLILVYSPKSHRGRILKSKKKKNFHRQRGMLLCADLSDKNIKYDAYFTWKNYDGYNNAEKAVFVWNGKDVGTGSEGLMRIFLQINKLPQGATLLIYPVYNFPMQSASNKERHYPFYYLKYGQERFLYFLFESVKNRKLTIIFSPRDHSNNFCKVYKYLESER